MTTDIQHKCTQWEHHQQQEFNMDTQIWDKTFIVFGTFTRVTPTEYRKEYPDSYHMEVNFCPFCGTKLDAV